MDDQTKNLIQEHINTNEVCLFMKGTPDAPQCGFSMAVSNILKILEVNYKGVNVLENQELREGVKVFSDWPTIPQLYIKKEFVGGCDIIKEMYESGELKKTLEDKGISYNKGVFPFLANSRARATGHTDGMVKLLADKKTDKLLGAHIIGYEAGTIIHEIAVGMSFGSSAEDIARTCHGHPTMNEAVKEAALAIGTGAIHI